MPGDISIFSMMGAKVRSDRGHKPHHPHILEGKECGFVYRKRPQQMNTPRDSGPDPTVTNIERETLQNSAFRSALWTGEHLQTTLMSIPVRGEIGLEKHGDTDQFLRIEQGQGLVQMGPSANQLTKQERVHAGSVIFVPAGTWHNLTNIGRIPIKLYSIYAPPAHPHGTVHQTKADSDAEEH